MLGILVSTMIVSSIGIAPSLGISVSFLLGSLIYMNLSNQKAKKELFSTYGKIDNSLNNENEKYKYSIQIIEKVEKEKEKKAEIIKKLKVGR